MLILLVSYDFSLGKGIISVQNTAQIIINSPEMFFHPFIFCFSEHKCSWDTEVDLSLSYQSVRSSLTWNIRGWVYLWIGYSFWSLFRAAVTSLANLKHHLLHHFILLPRQINRIYTELLHCVFKETRLQEYKPVNKDREY